MTQEVVHCIGLCQVACESSLDHPGCRRLNGGLRLVAALLQRGLRNIGQSTTRKHKACHIALAGLLPGATCEGPDRSQDTIHLCCSEGLGSGAWDRRWPVGLEAYALMPLLRVAQALQEAAAVRSRQRAIITTRYKKLQSHWQTMGYLENVGRGTQPLH